MNLSYELFIDAFLRKIREYEFLKMPEGEVEDEITGYMKTAISEAYEIKLDLLSKTDDINMEFVDVDIEGNSIYELVNIISDGMVMHWLYPYLHNQENLENVLNTSDYNQYSPANLLEKVGNAYSQCEKRFIQKRRDYSFNHNDLTELHI